MAGRRLSPEEQARWAELARSVHPLPGRRIPSPPSIAIPRKAAPIPPLTADASPPAARPTLRSPSAVLDTGWEKRIRSGSLKPDIAIDLHGHSLSAAHARLNQALAMACAQGARTMLVVTGKPRKAGNFDGVSSRGAIRSEIGHWLSSSPYADDIASVRVAHPRHGADGALYVILRRKK